MVKNNILKKCSKFTIYILITIFRIPTFAIFQQTQSDLAVLSDQLQNELQKNPGLAQEWTPLLIGVPQSYWKESASDFASVTYQMLQQLFNNQELILCPECIQNRTYVSHDGKLNIINGEMSLADLAVLKTRPNYKNAKSFLTIKESPAGVETKLIRISDGKILFMTIADSTKTLESSFKPLHLAKELERRQSGQSLNYVFIDFGFYQGNTLQFEFLEQWGDRNQHLSGLVLSLWEPVGGLGATYHYLIPNHRKLNFSLTTFITLFSYGNSANPKNPVTLVYQAMGQWAISGNYALFGMANSKGTISFGITFLNPVLFPFLL